MSTPKSIIVIGAGGHAKVVIETLLEMGITPIGVTDADPSRTGEKLLGIQILGDDRILEKYPPSQVDLVIGIGSTQASPFRQTLFESFKVRGYHFVGICHPSAVIGRETVIGEGAQIMAGVVIQPGCSIGQGVIVNTGARIDHDSFIGTFSHIAPGATLAGNVHVGDNCHIGCGASVLQNILIGDNATVGLGAAVIRDVAPDSRVIGVPARETAHA